MEAVMGDALTGACHCGSVSFHLVNPARLVVNCHCDECKKRNGSAFSTYLAVAEQDLVFDKGRECLREYKIDGEGIKYFCGECGSPMYNRNFRFPGLYLVFYGAMNQAATYRPVFNVYCESRHDWVDTVGKLRSFRQGVEK